MKRSAYPVASALALSIALWVAASNANAQSAWYYEMGGSEPISKPVWSSQNSIPLNVSGEFGWSYSCGKFSITNSVNKLLQDVRTAADDYLNAMIANAQAAVASLPAIILQRANPTLYDIMQNGLLRAQARANAARLDCQAMEQAIAANGKGLGGVWENLRESAKLTDWKAQATYTRNDIVQAQRNVENAAGANGIPWVGINGSTVRAGGSNQPPIRLTADVMGAGYEMAVRAGNPQFASFTSTPEKLTEPNAKAFGLFTLFNMFPTKQAAQDYISRVAGETIATTTETGTKTSRPGSGLNEDVARETQRVLALLRAAVNTGRALTTNERNAITTTALLSDQLMRSIRDLPRDDRDLIVQRLAGEIALQNEINRALLAIQIMNYGSGNPTIAANSVAEEHSADVVSKMKTYIDDLLYEMRIRKELVGETSQMVLARANAQRTAPVIEPERTDTTEPGLGTVKK